MGTKACYVAAYALAALVLALGGPALLWAYLAALCTFHLGYRLARGSWFGDPDDWDPASAAPAPDRPRGNSAGDAGSP